MKAVCYERYGSPEVLQLREIPKPSPRKDEILVKIRATSVTSSEAQMRQGRPYYGRPILGLTKPSRKVLGLEFAGEVVGRGSEVRKFGLGDRVFGFTGFRCGGYAQYICVPENESVILMPGKVSFEEAVALVDGPTTALFFLNKAKDQGIGKGLDLRCLGKHRYGSRPNRGPTGRRGDCGLQRGEFRIGQIPGCA